jgi:membrane protein
MKYVKRYFSVLKHAGAAFIDDNGIKLSAALSYYTVFAIGPLIMIVLYVTGKVAGEAAVQGRLYGQIRGLLGSEAALQVQEIVQNLQKTQTGTLGAIIGVIVLILGATGIFTEIQDSINYIWSLKAKPKRGIVKLIRNRLLSFSLIISLGFLFLVSLLLNTLMDLLSDRLMELFPNTMYYVFYLVNLVIVLAVITLLFAVIFKVLPDGTIKWKDSFIGAFFTAILFSIGKTLIGLYLGNSSLGATYGAAASVIIILTWVYYTSIILYFGAEFTKVNALEYGKGIVPNNTAVFIVKQESKEITVRHKHPEANKPSEIAKEELPKQAQEARESK